MFFDVKFDRIARHAAAWAQLDPILQLVAHPGPGLFLGTAHDVDRAQT
jgi:hypothetical protein